MKIFFIITLSIAFIYIAIASVLYIFQRDFLYHPSPNYQHSFDEIEVSNQGQSLSVIVLNSGHTDAIIYFGGNGEAVINNAEKFTSDFSTKTIYLLNYRGYGASSGSPSEAANFSDALALYEKITSTHGKISAMGRSLGSGVATYLAAEKKIDKLILITPYDSILNIAKRQFGFLPLSLLLKDKYDSVSRAHKIQSQVLILAAEQDVVIPLKNTQTLANAFINKNVTFTVIKNSGHNTISNTREYYELIKEFL